MATVRGPGARALQWLGLLVLAAVTIGLCYLALTRETADDGAVAQDDPGSSATDAPAPTDDASPSDQPDDDDISVVPKVPDQRRVDFIQGDGLPDGSTTYDAPSNATGLQVTTAGLTHGAAGRGKGDGLGLVETKLKSDVRSLGFRVRFPEGRSGSAVMVAWKSSAVAAIKAGADALPTGLRFVATSGTWSLSTLSDGGEQVLVDGTFAPGAGPLEFRVVRDGDQIYVVDPAGQVTETTQPRVKALTGPFASWGLLEDRPGQVPAVIESVWAG